MGDEIDVIMAVDLVIGKSDWMIDNEKYIWKKKNPRNINERTTAASEIDSSRHVVSAHSSVIRVIRGNKT